MFLWRNHTDPSYEELLAAVSEATLENNIVGSSAKKEQRRALKAFLNGKYVFTELPQ